MTLLAISILVLGMLFAFVIGGLMRFTLRGAHKNENGVLLVLHVFWLATIMGFVLEFPLLLR